MQNLLLLQMMGFDFTEDLQEVKSQQASCFALEASKIIFRSKVRTVEQDEILPEGLYDMKPTDSTASQSLLLSMTEFIDNSARKRLLSLDELTKDRRVDACLISLDLEKAFDRISHRTDYMKVLGIWLGGVGACAKTWEEHIAKVRQKLGYGSTAPSPLQKFAKRHNIRKWSAHNTLETLWEKEMVDPL
eukprot:g39704.t1